MADICALSAVTLFIIFFWCPTNVTPSAVSSCTVTRAAASKVVTPDLSKLSAYRDILMEASHSLTEVSCVKSTASGASGLVPLSKISCYTRILRFSGIFIKESRGTL